MIGRVVCIIQVGGQGYAGRGRYFSRGVRVGNGKVGYGRVSTEGSGRQ